MLREVLAVATTGTGPERIRQRPPLAALRRGVRIRKNQLDRPATSVDAIGKQKISPVDVSQRQKNDGPDDLKLHDDGDSLVGGRSAWAVVSGKQPGQSVLKVQIQCAVFLKSQKINLRHPEKNNLGGPTKTEMRIE